MIAAEGKGSGRGLEGEWRSLRRDPVREELLERGEKPDLDRVLSLFPRTKGDPAFDAAVIAGSIDRLETDPEVDTGHPFLDLSVKTGLAFVDATFQGDHPKYGVKGYGQNQHDAFPPTIIASVDALSGWGLGERAAELFRYWLTHFVRADGSIDYYGPSVSEYGQLLHTGALLLERAGPAGWWEEGFGALDGMAEWLLRLRADAETTDGLLFGSPEADRREDTGKYFHNSAWAARGLERWAEACGRVSASPTTTSPTLRGVAKDLARDTLAAIERTWPTDPEDWWHGHSRPVPRAVRAERSLRQAGRTVETSEAWWLAPRVEPVERPGCLTGTTLASYTNYRYWPELLSSGLLPREVATRVVESRLTAGGQFCGMTRFQGWLDDWPLADYLFGLWSLGRRDDFALSLYGHVAYHQAGEHLTAYEQVTAPPFREQAPYCLPCQLVAARAARLLVEEGP